MSTYSSVTVCFPKWLCILFSDGNHRTTLPSRPSHSASQAKSRTFGPGKHSASDLEMNLLSLMTKKVKGDICCHAGFYGMV